MLDPQVGKPDVGLRTFTPKGGLLWYKCSPVCESPTQQLWDLSLLYCTPPTVSLWLLLCLWMWGIFFGEFQCLPVGDCSAVSCDSGALTRRSEHTSFYSAIFFVSFLSSHCLIIPSVVSQKYIILPGFIIESLRLVILPFPK